MVQSAEMCPAHEARAVSELQRRSTRRWSRRFAMQAMCAMACCVRTVEIAAHHTMAMQCHVSWGAGWFQIPAAIDQPLELALNPSGDAWRSERRVWDAGDGRTKLVCLAAPPSPDPEQQPGEVASTGAPQQALSRA